MHYDWNFWRLEPYVGAFASGAITTVALTLLTIILGTVGGIPLSYIVLHRRTRLFVIPFVDIIRAVPPLVLLLFTYYFITPQVVGIDLSAFWVAVIALSANLAVFTADVFRAGIEGVPRGEIDAARALGLSRRQIQQHVVLPSVLKQSLPALVVLYIGMLKLSSLAALITVYELVFVAQTVIADVSRSLEVWVVVAATYVALVVPATYGARHFERWLLRGRPAR